MLFDDDPCSSERFIKIRVAFAPNKKLSRSFRLSAPVTGSAILFYGFIN